MTRLATFSMRQRPLKNINSARWEVTGCSTTVGVDMDEVHVTRLRCQLCLQYSFAERINLAVTLNAHPVSLTCPTQSNDHGIRMVYNCMNTSADKHAGTMTKQVFHALKFWVSSMLFKSRW